jgi:hypothetical protein
MTLIANIRISSALFLFPCIPPQVLLVKDELTRNILWDLAVFINMRCTQQDRSERNTPIRGKNGGFEDFTEP